MSRCVHPCWPLLGAALLPLMISEHIRPKDESAALARMARLAEVEEMEGCIRGDWARGIGPPLRYRYWADQERKKETTVRQKLLDIGARLRDGEVVDSRGKVVFFWRAVEFSGAWPDDLRREVEEGVKVMEDKYRLIRMYRGPRRR